MLSQILLHQMTRIITGLQSRCLSRSVVNFKNLNRHHPSLFSVSSTNAMASNEINSIIKQQPFDYYLVLDFEATCDLKEANRKIVPKEIIEFPVLKVNGKTFETEATFHTYVQPKVHPKLTPFCIELTGITQDHVDGKPGIEQVLKDFDAWLQAEGLFSTRFTFVACGDWDLNIMLPEQCNYFNIPIQVYFSTWINIKRTFADHTTKWVRGMMEMLKMLKLEHQGRHHSGIDDCRNIAAILGELAKQGAVVDINGWRKKH